MDNKARCERMRLDIMLASAEDEVLIADPRQNESSMALTGTFGMQMRMSAAHTGLNVIRNSHATATAVHATATAAPELTAIDADLSVPTVDNEARHYQSTVDAART